MITAQPVTTKTHGDEVFPERSMEVNHPGDVGSGYVVRRSNCDCRRRRRPTTTILHTPPSHCCVLGLLILNSSHVRAFSLFVYNQCTLVIHCRVAFRSPCVDATIPVREQLYVRPVIRSDISSSSSLSSRSSFVVVVVVVVVDTDDGVVVLL